MTEKKSAPKGASQDLNIPGTTTSPAGSQASALNPDHRAELHASAISDNTIATTGVYTAYTRDELPEPLRWIADAGDTLPALVFPMMEAGRGTTWQVKPQSGSLIDGDGRAIKYVCPKKGRGYIPPSYIERRPITAATRRVLIVEGTKQTLAALSHTDSETAIFGIPGIQSWMGGEAGPSPAFAQLKGHSVYIVPDADAGSNRAVYDSARALGEHCRAWGASPVRFVRVPGHGKQGLDDVLASVAEDERAEMLELWVRQAQDKPANKMPKKARKQRGADESGDDARPKLFTDMPPEDLWDRAWAAIRDEHAGKTLFRQDARPVMISRRDGRAVLVPVDRATGRRLAASAFDLLRVSDDSVAVVAPMDRDVDVLFSPIYTDALPPLHSVTRSPLVTETGEIVTRSGYHAGVGVYVDLDDDLVGISVPNAPSAQDVEDAKNLLEDVLCDFSWVTPADRTRALGALLTPLVRPMVPTAPMHLVSAVRRSSGKGLLTDVVHLIATGETAAVQDLPGNETEMRKMIASTLFAGASTLFLDECSAGVDSKALSALLTAEMYTDRILGESRTISVRNNLCIFAAGNNPAIDGDLSRRVVPILLDPKCSRPESRSGFRHPQLRTYVRENRKALLAAALTLIRAWAVAGRPGPSVAGPFGSFEAWYDVVGGVLEQVGYTDLSADLDAIRARYNASEQEAAEHLAWLYTTMSGDFRAYDAECAIKGSTDYVPLPPGLASLDEATARRLGRAYSRLQGAWIGGYCLESAGVKHHTRRFRVVREDDPDDGPDNGGGPDDDGTPPGPSSTGETGDIGALVFDLETGSADDLHVTDDPGWVRLAAYAVDGGEPVVTTDIEGELIPLIERSETVVGHNVVQYDLAALGRLYGLDVDKLVAEGHVHDTLVMARLADPPTPKKRYGLGAVAQRLGLDGKLVSDGESALQALSREHGGYDQTPVDDATYRAYAAQDVRTTAAVYELLLPRAIDVVGEDYLRREHRITHRLAQVEAQGIRVDTELVVRMLAEEEAVRAEIRAWLASTVGVPDRGKAPWASAAGKRAIADYIERQGGEVPRTSTGAVSVSTTSMERLAETGVPELVELAEQVATALQASSPAAMVQKHVRGGRVYPSIQASQATGRLSTTSPAMTIFGSRDDRLLAQRAMILPDTEDQVLVSVDLSGIDARCMAAGSGDSGYSALFAPGVDVHTETAKTLFGDASWRADAKAVNHAINYGMGADNLSRHLGVSVRKAEKILADLGAAYPSLADFKRRLRGVGETAGYVTSGFGRRVAVARDKPHKAPSAYGQGTARDVFLEGVLALPDEIAEMIRIFVHDELVLSVPRDRAEDIKAAVIAAFESVELPGPGGGSVPVLAAAAGPAETWAGCK